MKVIQFPSIYDNLAAHKQVLALMKEKIQLSIQLDDEPNAWISTKTITRLRYQLNVDNWKWLLHYMMTGEHEDFGIQPYETSTFSSDVQEHMVKELIEQKYSISRVPFLREYRQYITLVGTFEYGNVCFRIPTTSEFLTYLHHQGL